MELFSQPKGAVELKAHLPGNLFSFIRHYEKTLLLVICFIIAGIISFSLGVEKGKRITKVTLQNNMAIPQAQEPRADKAQNIPAAPAKPQPKIKEYIENYTIQVASYKTRGSAQTEAEVLRKKGFSPLLIPKSGYIVLCIGNFSTKETARTSLSEFKKLYRDCFVRRL